MSRIKGVMLFLFAISDDNVTKILVLRELKDKPAFMKKAGMLSVPAETCEPEDGSLENTIQRMLVEEVDARGGANENTMILGIGHRPSQPIPTRDDVDVYYAWGIYLGSIADAVYWKPQDSDVELVGWMTVREFFANEVRVEIRPMLQAMLADKEFKKWSSSPNKKESHLQATG